MRIIGAFDQMIKKMDKKAILFICLMVAWMVFLPHFGFGQEDGGEAPVEDKTFLQVFQSGGLTMYFLLALSIGLVTFSVEGFIKIRLAKLAPPAVIASLRDVISSGNYQQAWQVCDANMCFLSRVVGNGLERIGKGKDIFENAMADVSVKEGARLKSNLNYLSVIGVVSPMFGLFGTVTGMIKAFDTLGSKGVTDFSALSSAISEALVTTAGGLVVGIPAFILYYVLRNQANKLVAAADTEAFLLVEDIPVDQLAGLQVGPQVQQQMMQPGMAPQPEMMG